MFRCVLLCVSIYVCFCLSSMSGFMASYVRRRVHIGQRNICSCKSNSNSFRPMYIYTLFEILNHNFLRIWNFAPVSWKLRFVRICKSNETLTKYKAPVVGKITMKKDEHYVIAIIFYKHCFYLLPSSFLLIYI